MSQFKKDVWLAPCLLGVLLVLLSVGRVFSATYINEDEYVEPLVTLPLLPAASNEHLGTPQEKTWTPRFPDRADVDTYCATWGQKAIHGVGAYLLATPQERERSLVITFQSSEEDHAHPEIFRTVEMDDGAHATVILVTDGWEQDAHWIYDEQSKQDVSTAVLEGWDWAAEHFDEADTHRGAPRNAWEYRLFNACKHEGAAK